MQPESNACVTLAADSPAASQVLDTASSAPSDKQTPENSPPFVSFAQNFEDVMLWRALGHIQHGFYIDIGAAEPEADSVTKAFYDRGWSGINIEPAAGPFARLAAARPRDRNMRLLVGDSIGSQEFFLIGDENALSTALPELAARHATSGWSCRTTTVPMTTLATICAQHVRGEVHFLKIDAEWSELAILRGADFTRFRPWIIVFEATPIGTGPHSYEDCERVLEDSGYRFLYADGLNRFWGAGERHAELAPHFTVPPNVFDNFVRAAEVSGQADVANARDELAQANARLTEYQRIHEEARADTAIVRDELAQANARLTEYQRIHEEARNALAQTQAHLAEQEHLRADLEQRMELLTREAAEAQQTAHIAASALQRKFSQASAERDAYMQELFETNRYTGFLTGERQTLLDRVAALTAEIQNVARARDTLAVQAQGLQHWLDAVYASTSWKFARPVRGVKKLLGGKQT